MDFITSFFVEIYMHEQHSIKNLINISICSFYMQNDSSCCETLSKDRN